MAKHRHRKSTKAQLRLETRKEQEKESTKQAILEGTLIKISNSEIMFDYFGIEYKYVMICVMTARDVTLSFRYVE